MSTVVILLSDKRSGSTMLQRELCRHPEVQTVPYSPHTYLETHWWLLSAVLLERPARLFAGGRRYNGYGGRSNARAYMIKLLARCVPDFGPPADDKALVMTGWEALCERLARPVFFEKSPQVLAHWAALSLMLEWLEVTTHEVRILGLVRNPHGTMYSAAKLFGTEPAARQIGWLETYVNLLAVEAMVPRNRFLRLRYEDLVDNPAGGFAAICSLIGVTRNDAPGSGVAAASVDKWKCDPNYRLSLDPAVRQMAVHFGYADHDLDNPNANYEAERSPRAVREERLRRWLNRQRDSVVHPTIHRLKNRFRSGR